jgi:hypothetical protein
MRQNALIRPVLTALEELGLRVVLRTEPKAANRRADAYLRVIQGQKHVDYVVEVKRAVTPATVGAVLAQVKDLAEVGRRVLLVTDYLTPPVAEKLHEAKQQFADTAGNAYLDAAGLLVYINGRKPKKTRVATEVGQTLTVNGLKILFALLCDPVLAETPHRAIAAAAGVALGAVPPVLQGLRQTGHLLVVDRRRRLNATKRLLDEWALLYARKLRPKTLQAKYTTPNFDNWRDWKVNLDEARWGGEPAGALLTDYLRPGNLTLYTERLPPRLMVEQRMVHAERLTTERLVEVREPFWGPVLNVAGRADTVPPVLVYADLLATGDGRCMETAQMVYDRYLARLLPAA